MLAFIDDNKNRKLDFDKKGKAMETYATFSEHVFANEQELNFSNTSGDFNGKNAKVLVKWKK